MKIGVMLRAIDERQGIGIYTKNLMDHLLRLDTKNEYVLFYRTAEFLGRYAQCKHVREKLVQAPNKLIWDQIMIPLEARREGVDIILHTKFTAPLLTCRKTVMVLHGSEWFVYPRAYKLLDRNYIRIMMPLYCKKATRIIANSDFTKSDFVNILGISKENIRTIYFGVHPRFRRLDNLGPLERTREKFQLPEKFILCVSSKVYAGKCIGTLITAFSKIHTSIAHKIVIAGKTPDVGATECRLIEQLGLGDKILFTGWVPHDDLVAFYNLADVFVFPSLYEGFGIPIIEAMACGCPVIASRAGALPEIAGDAALLFDPVNADELAEAMRRVLREETLRINLREKGMVRSKAFTWEKCAEDTLEVLEGLAGDDWKAGELGTLESYSQAEKVC